MSRLPGTPEAGTEARPRTAIVTGASRGIGAGVTGPFIDLGYNVVANALHFADSTLVPNANLALAEGNIGQASTSVRVTETPISPLDYGRVMPVVDKWKPYGGLIYFICCWTHWSGPGISGGTPQERTLSASEPRAARATLTFGGIA